MKRKYELFSKNETSQASQKNTFSEIKEFLIKNANAIQKLATQHHKTFLGNKRFRSEFIDKYQQNHVNVVEAFAQNLEQEDIKKGTENFKKLGQTLAKDSVKDGLTLEEAVDGIIFLKQATWEMIQKKKLLDQLTIKDFYQLNQNIGTYCDIVASKLALTYHEEYVRNLKQEVDERKKADKLKDEFIGIASHELKTPITSLKANVQVLHHKFMQQENIKSVEQLAKMDAQLNRLTNLIRDLLDMTKIEGGKLQFHQDFFDLNELIREIVDEMQKTTTKHEIITKLGKPCVVYADRDRIGQVITNLISNAIKYSPKTHEILITTITTKQNVTCCVKDFGVGIPKSKQLHVFKRFYQVDEGKASEEGLGLGLYISSEIITLQGGRIWVESEPGEGSTFCFTLANAKVIKAD